MKCPWPELPHFPPLAYLSHCITPHPLAPGRVSRLVVSLFPRVVLFGQPMLATRGHLPRPREREGSFCLRQNPHLWSLPLLATRWFVVAPLLLWALTRGGSPLARSYRNQTTHFDDADDQPAQPVRKARRNPTEGIFKCVHCRRFVAPVPSGGGHRNHCPFCLHSRHVDAAQSGDRLSDCGARMAPIGAFQRQSGEHVIVHQCLGCGFERFNRIAADDDFALVLTLPEVPPRSRRTEVAVALPDGGVLLDFQREDAEEAWQASEHDELAG
jgi:hypothetical protein